MSAMKVVVAQALRTAAKFNAQSSAPPVAVFWPDPDRSWEAVIALLQAEVPILVLGEYEPAKAQGPAIWLRAVMADPESVKLPPHLARHDAQNPWVIYLPGLGRSSLSDSFNLQASIAPLVEVALRSNWWPSAHGHAAWAPHSFFGSKNGADLDIAGDAKTKTALDGVLDSLLAEDIDELRRMGRLDSTRLHSLVMSDSIRTLLEWIDDPESTRNALQGAHWVAFKEACRTTYGFDPAKDGVLTAAAHLCAREGAWGAAWARFADNPRRYTNIPNTLDKTRPEGDLFGEAEPHPDSWPSWNLEQEAELRISLTALNATKDLDEARAGVKEFSAKHSRREESVWGELGLAPLATATGYLAELADLTSAGVPGNDVNSLAEWFVFGGYKIDDFALRALAASPKAADRDAVRKALQVIYDPWLDKAARAFQTAAVINYEGHVGLDVQAGTCVVFVDALRFDLAQRLVKRFPSLSVAISSRLAAFPTVTPTGQPAVAPVAATFGAGQAFDAADAQGRSVKGTVFRSALSDAGVQYLDWKSSEIGDVNGVGWTQTNTIDALGHDHDHALSDMIDHQLDLVAERVKVLLTAGWRLVVVVTDHGFLLPAGPALKVALPLAVTEGDAARKPRVARLKAGAARPNFPIVTWTWDTSVEMVSAPGAAAFEAGTLYEHGGLSLQECVIPVLEVSGGGGAAAPAQIEEIRWTGQRCRIDYKPAEADVVAEVRLSSSDASSAVGGPKSPAEPGEIKVLVDEDQAADGTAAYVVLLRPDGAVIAQCKTKIGGGE